MNRSVLFEETVTTTVEVTPTPVPGIVFAEYCSATNPLARFVDREQLGETGSLEAARTYMAQKGMVALTDAGWQKVMSSDRESLVDGDTLVRPQLIRSEQLVRDHRWHDGFVYRHAHATPLSTPITDFICQSTVNMSADLINALTDHPWVTTPGKLHYVPGNGDSLTFSILLPQLTFDELYEEMATRDDPHFGSYRMWEQLIGIGSYVDEPGEFDLLGVHHLMQRGHLDEDNGW